MDPASAIGVVSGAATLAATAVQTTMFLMSLKDSYDNAGLMIWDLIAASKAFEIAWNRIHDWQES
jgi:hypothetical protein